MVTGEVPGRLFVLEDPGPGFARQRDAGVLPAAAVVGEVASYALDPDSGKLLTVKVFVRAPYDQYVNPNTRFWHASAHRRVAASASGLKVQTQSVLSILIGGIAVRDRCDLAAAAAGRRPERLHAVQRPAPRRSSRPRRIRRPIS